MGFADATVLLLDQRLRERQQELGPALDRFLEAALANDSLLEPAKDVSRLVAGIATDLRALVDLRVAQYAVHPKGNA